MCRAHSLSSIDQLLATTEVATTFYANPTIGTEVSDPVSRRSLNRPQSPAAELPDLLPVREGVITAVFRAQSNWLGGTILKLP
jgi:hypothetical protein